jgi:virginiamycin A acetyltransferase
MIETFDEGGGRRSPVSSRFVVACYARTQRRSVRSFLRRVALKLEGGPMYSLTIRELFRQFHGVEVGVYTLGPCEADPDRLPPGTRIGRFSSIYWTARVVAADRPSSSAFPHGLVSDYALGTQPRQLHEPVQLEIGHDVFVGHNAIILASAREIGHGAFIGAGAVVQNPVPPFGIVMGNPARVVRYRFAEARIQEMLEMKWWLKNLDELEGEMAEFQKPLEGDSIV